MSQDSALSELSPVNFYCGMAINKLQREINNRLKEQIRLTLKRPTLTKIPFPLLDLLRYMLAVLLSLFISLFFYFGVSAIESSIAVIGALLLFPFTFFLMLRGITWWLNKPSGLAEELNLFVVGIKKDVKIKSGKTVPQLQEKMHKKIFNLYNKYLQLLDARERKEVLHDTNMNEFLLFFKKTTKILPTVTPQDLQEVNKKIKTVQSKVLLTYHILRQFSLIYVWEFQSNHEIFTFSGNHVVPLRSERLHEWQKDKNFMSQLKKHVVTIPEEAEKFFDLILSLNFSIHYNKALKETVFGITEQLANFEKILQQFSMVLQSNSPKTLTEQKKDDEKELLYKEPKTPFGALMMLFTNTCSGSAEIFRIYQRQLEKFIELKNAFKDLQQNHLNASFNPLVQVLDQENAFSELYNKVLALEKKLVSIAVTLRQLPYSDITRELLQNDPLKTIAAEILKQMSQLYLKLEYCRFLVNKFEDIEYFTHLQDGLALEAGVKETINQEMLSDEVVIAAKNLFKQYSAIGHTVYALRGISLTIKRGEFVVIFGPSGSGKTTLLNILSGLDKPDRGVVVLDGINLTKYHGNKLAELRRDKIGFVFQYYNLLPYLTSIENTKYPREIRGEILTPKTKREAEQLLKTVGIARFKNQFPTKLSGGQMQRVTIARALVNAPAIIFADEPTGDLDSKTGEQVMQLLYQFHQAGKTIIVVTHDKSLIKYATRVIKMKDGQIIADEYVKNPPMPQISQQTT